MGHPQSSSVATSLPMPEAHDPCLGHHLRSGQRHSRCRDFKPIKKMGK